jgi:hypothetical protein
LRGCSSDCRGEGGGGRRRSIDIDSVAATTKRPLVSFTSDVAFGGGGSVGDQFVSTKALFSVFDTCIVEAPTRARSYAGLDCEIAHLRDAAV